MATPEIPYRPAVVQPIECLKSAWEMVKNEYWLFVGMTAVGMLIGSAVPLGILLGPMMAGLYITFFKTRRRQPIEFGDLFKGFDFFGPSLVATLLHIIPILAIVLPAYFFFYITMVVSMVAQGDEPNPAAVFGVMGGFIIFWLVIMVVIVVVSIGFTFAYPLVVDRKLSGFDAVKVSFKGAFANFWRLLGMSVLTAILGICGLLLCYVGMFLVMPITYGAIAIAYEQVFGLADPSEMPSNLPPPPPTF
jgi:uncharacterized membrane protein